jgi:hypothetical protein
MAAPNLVSPTTITGKTTTTLVTTAATATSILSNAASSGKVLKINALYVANVDGTSALEVTVNYYPQAALAGTAVPIISTASVPADATLVVIDKEAYVYLEENRSIGITVGAAGFASGEIQVVCSYEEIS